ncbi:MAG TPA: translocation/assembly module TamB domain-containing protein, partial [Niastella sp.]
DETIAVNNEGIRFDSFTVEDSAKHKAVIDGMVYTTDFSKYKFDLTVRATDFQAMNSTKDQNKLYYGQLIFSSNMHIKGTNASPVVDGSITIGDKTNVTVVLPQTDPSVVKREGIVQFVDMDAPENDTLFRNMQLGFDSLNKSGITGLDISANVEIKKEAIFSMVVDEGNGDFIRMQGEGLLTGGIDPSGKITLSGSYEISGGAYELSYNLLRRKFEIQEGSKIVWNGEPTKADLTVTAIYKTKAAPMELVKNQVADQEENSRNVYLQRLPFEVLLKLEGELLQPKVSFDIQLPEESNEVSRGAATTINYRLTQLRQEPSELNKQVFALLLLNRFVGENPFESSAGGLTAEAFARQSASKLLTEQLNKLAGDLIQGVDLNFDVASFDDYSTGSAQTRTDLNVGLSKRLLNDRLTVSVGSNFELEGAQNTNRNTSNIAGNVAVDYSLSQDRRYMLRAYRKNEYEGVIEGYVIETGVGFIITLDYNKFKNLFLSKKAKEERRQRIQKLRELEQKKPTPPSPPQTYILSPETGKPKSVKTFSSYYLWLALSIILLYSCSSTKTVPAGDALYTGAKITIKDKEESRKKRKALTKQLGPLTRPEPNQKILGIPLKLNIYNAFQAKKGPGKWIREKFGQPPVLLSSVNLNHNVQVLNNYLINKGYFNAKVEGDTTVKRKKASAEYAVTTGAQYHVQKVEFKGDSSVLQQAVRETMPKTLL